VVEITAEGRPLAMLVPVTLINANLDVASEIV
jgi:antitoxin (DNA-binding transcriptional repressor) of toxin-antitoxin stability system